VQNATLWQALLGVERTVIEDIEFDEEEQLLVADVRPRERARGRCGWCGRRSPAYDRGEGRRRWRTLDLGTIQTVLKAEAPRIRCPEHGPTVAAVPWARHAAGHTYAFDEQVTLAGHPMLQERDHKADADRLAHRWRDHHPGIDDAALATGVYLCSGPQAQRPVGLSPPFLSPPFLSPPFLSPPCRSVTCREPTRPTHLPNSRVPLTPPRTGRSARR